MASTRVVVDPITRIEGHLRIEAQTEGGKITRAWSTATQFRLSNPCRYRWDR